METSDISFDKNKDLLQYSLGGLLYCPALNPKAPDFITSEKIKGLRSVSLCLEDSIGDDSVEAAEQQLLRSFEEIYRKKENGTAERKQLPLLFVRVRSAEQLLRVYDNIGSFGLLTGFILPKFDRGNAYGYITALKDINRTDTVYAMPIIESREVMDIGSRRSALIGIKSAADDMRDIVLNIRVGGNDFCSSYGLRRPPDMTVYDIGVVRDVLADIFNVFGRDHTVSAPVWEYFGTDPNGSWAKGLRAELKLDRINGFIGKTAIHPSQLPLIENSLAVTREDLSDAEDILSWGQQALGVAKSSDGGRMNEVKVHTNWAKKIKALAAIYGVKEGEFI